jgi:parvulin-like peptidyl-prolyl isomerase
MTYLLIFSLIFVGCSTSSENDESTSLDYQKKNEIVLAKIGDQNINYETFITFSKSIPSGMKEGTTQLEESLHVLNSLIDKKLLLIEANSLPLDQSIDFKDEIAVYSKNRLLELYTKTIIADQVEISDAELDAHFIETGRNRALRYNGIMLETKQEAENVLKEVHSGRDFMSLAKGRSVHRESGEQGGDVGGYHLKDNVYPAIAEPLFKLKVGEITEPIRMTFKGKPHYAIFQVSDEIPVKRSTAESKVQEEVFGIKRADRYMLVLDSLKTVHDPKINSNIVDWLVSSAESEDKDPFAQSKNEKSKILCQLKTSSISIEKFTETARQMHIGRNEIANRDRLKYLISDIIIPAHLFEIEARGLNLHENTALRSKVTIKREDMLLNALREKFVDSKINASDVEAKNFYDTNPIKFMTPLTTEIEEVLVENEELAKRIILEINKGAKIDSIAKIHTIREGAAHHDGKLSISVFTKAYYQDIFDAAQTNTVGEIVGPLKVPLGYSIFKILERKQELKPFNDSSKKRAKAYVKIDKSKRGYVAYVQQLRKKYGVAIFKDVFAKAL